MNKMKQRFAGHAADLLYSLHKRYGLLRWGPLAALEDHLRCIAYPD